MLTTDEAQVVFTDTPGFHKPRTLLGARLNDLVGDAVTGVDVIVLVVDGHMGVGRGDAFVYAKQVAGEPDAHEDLRGQQDRPARPHQGGAAAGGRAGAGGLGRDRAGLGRGR